MHDEPEAMPPRRNPLLLACALHVIVLLTAVMPAAAQGWIEPLPGRPAAGGGVVQLRSVVTVHVIDRVAHVQVEEWFRNDGGAFGESDYLYPFAGEAVFRDFSLFQGDDELRGEALDAARARAIYEQIVRERRDPALIELFGHGLIRARVFPFEPGETRRITLRYTQLLERSGDALFFRYAAGSAHRRPIALGPVAPEPLPRPVPQFDEWEGWISPGWLPPVQLDALRIEAAADGRVVLDSREVFVRSLDRGPARGAVRLPVARPDADTARLSFTLLIDDARAFRDATSPTHALDVQRAGRRMTVRPRTTPDGELSIVLPFAERAVGLSLLAHRPAAGDAGYFMLTLSPADVAAARVPRDVTAVIDVSGSMSGEKMAQTRRAVVQVLGTLDAEDRFRLITFSSRVTAYRADWTAATRAELAAAQHWAEALEASGGTDIGSALSEALRLTSPDGRLPIVIFMTDGQPTVGETNGERIVERAERMRGAARIFAFGVGYDVNTRLLDALSAAGRGTTQYVRPAEDVESAIASLAARIRHPVLTDLAIADAPVRLSEIYPTRLPDLYAGEDLVVFGRYTVDARDTRGDIVVQGRRHAAGGTHAERHAAAVTFPAHAPGNEFVSRLWASRKLGELGRAIRLRGPDPELVDELRATALRYGLLSEYTSYLVVEPEQRPGVAAPALPDIGRRAGARQLSAMPVTGAAAVERAEAGRQARDVRSVAELETAQHAASGMAAGRLAPAGVSAGGAPARLVAGRYFVERDGVMHDTAVDPAARVIEIAPFGAAYFALLAALPELKPVLAAYDRVLIGGGRLSIRIAPGGATSFTAREIEDMVRAFRARQGG